MVEQSSFPLIVLFWLKIGRCLGRDWLYGNQALVRSIFSQLFIIKSIVFALDIFLNNQLFCFNQSGIPLLIKAIFCLLFIIKSMVFAPDIFLNNQLFCLYWEDHQTEKSIEFEQSSFPLIVLFWLKIGRCRGRDWLYGNQALVRSIFSQLFIIKSIVFALDIFLNNQLFCFNQSGIPLLIKAIFCLLFIIKSMVLAPDIFLNNQLFCLYWEDHQTEKSIEFDQAN